MAQTTSQTDTLVHPEVLEFLAADAHVHRVLTEKRIQHGEKAALLRAIKTIKRLADDVSYDLHRFLGTLPTENNVVEVVLERALEARALLAV